MTITSIRYQVLSSRPAPFGEMAASILSQCSHLKEGLIPLRLVFFANPAPTEAYRSEYQLLKEMIAGVFGNRMPAFSYLAQPPVGEGMYAELHLLEYRNEQLCFGQSGGVPYVAVTTPFSKELFAGGFMADNPQLPVLEQAEQIFGAITQCLHNEAMPVASIIRQWNYIEAITATDASGKQHYQLFNDARWAFYQTTEWSAGYPAATGIGTTCGGLVIDFEAALSLSSGVSMWPIDNKMQISAHEYSQEVLRGEAFLEGCGKSTPKFERAKVWAGENSKRLYISGTASIRGEKSIGGLDVTEQTRITLENMEFLTQQITDCPTNHPADPLTHRAVDPPASPFTLLRIYLKQPEFREMAEKVLESRYKSVPSIWITADVCREELLVEIEAMSLH